MSDVKSQNWPAGTRALRLIGKLIFSAALLVLLCAAACLLFLTAGLQLGPDQLADYTIYFVYVSPLTIVALFVTLALLLLPVHKVSARLEDEEGEGITDPARAWRSVNRYPSRAMIAMAGTWTFGSLLVALVMRAAGSLSAGQMAQAGVCCSLVGVSGSVCLLWRARAMLRDLLGSVSLMAEAADIGIRTRWSVRAKVVFTMAVVFLSLAFCLLVVARSWREKGWLDTAMAIARQDMGRVAEQITKGKRKVLTTYTENVTFTVETFLVDSKGELAAGKIQRDELEFVRSHHRLLGQSSWAKQYPFKESLVGLLSDLLTPLPAHAYFEPAKIEGKKTRGTKSQKWVLLQREPLRGGLRPGAILVRVPQESAAGARRQNLYLFTLLIISFLVIGGLASIWLADEIGAPLTNLDKALQRSKYDSDSAVIPVETDGEIGTVAVSIRESIELAIAKLDLNRSVLSGIRDSTERLNDVLMTMVQVVAEQASGSSQHAVSLQEISSTSEEIAATLRMIAESAKSVDEVAGQTLSSSHQGQQHLGEVVSGMERSVERANEVAEKMIFFQEQSNRIEDILNFIREIAAKINIIALNASIEASSMGDEGDRFIIVAQQMRDLAEQTTTGANQIQRIFNDLQAATSSAILATEEGGKLVTDSRTKAEQASDDFQNIVHWAGETARAAQEIALSSKQQTSATDHLASALTDIREVAGKIAEAAQLLEISVGELENTTEELKGLLSMADDEAPPEGDTGDDE